MRKCLFCVFILLVAVGMAAFGAGDPEQATASGAAMEYTEGDPYYWVTPAAYEAATGNEVGELKEAPVLSSMVVAGELPPVEQRVPTEPLVVGRTIGKYGGTLYHTGGWRAKLYGAAPWGQQGLATPEYSWEYNSYPNLAKSLEMSDGGKRWTVELREGTHWSDGESFDVEDIMFWWEDVYTIEGFGVFATRLQRNAGNWQNIRRIDDYTFEIAFDPPSTALNYVWASMALPGYAKHYFSQFHPRYTDQGKLDDLVAEGGFESWQKLFAHMNDDDGKHNLERPMLLPWILIKGQPGDTIMERNPYYWAIDPAGNQLPYIDEVYRYVDLESDVAQLKALSGELDMAVVNMETFNLAKERENQGKIIGKRYGDNVFIAAGLLFNQTHQDPALRAIFQDKRFRIGASHAINREQINQLVFFGISEPWQAAPWENSAYYHERYAHTALEYDPDKANSLLAEAGLQKGGDGMWRQPDGSELQINLVNYSGGDTGRIAELITDDLRAVGLDINLKSMTGSQFYQLAKANDLDAVIMGGAGMGGEGWIWTQPLASAVVPVDSWDGAWAPLWQKWYESKGAEGEEPIPEIKEAMRLYREGQATIDPAVHKENYRKIADIAADNLWTIGTVKWPGFYKIYSTRLANWPTVPLAYDRGGDKGRPEILYFK